MAKPGRKSEAELTTVSSIPSHLDAPEGLTPEQVVIWGEAVRSMEVGFFKVEHKPSLEAYCRHVARERKLSRALEGMDVLTDAKAYKELVGMAKEESGKILAHMRSLRLTPQSQYDAQKASRKSERAACDLS